MSQSAMRAIRYGVWVSGSSGSFIGVSQSAMRAIRYGVNGKVQR